MKIMTMTLNTVIMRVLVMVGTALESAETWEKPLLVEEVEMVFEETEETASVERGEEATVCMAVATAAAMEMMAEMAMEAAAMVQAVVLQDLADALVA